MSDWTESEELAFSQLMAAGNLDRLPAIRLYRRFRGDVKRALAHLAPTPRKEKERERNLELFPEAKA